MNTDMTLQMAESIRNFRLPRYSELPDMGLYLEQTTKYINTCLAPLGCLEVTPSMVSNYVKKGLVPNPVKKQYGARHIAVLFFVVLAKNLVTIEEIALLLELQQNSYPLDVAYDYLCSELENALGYVFGLKDTMDKLGKTKSAEKTILANLAYSAANVIHLHACFESIRTAKNA